MRLPRLAAFVLPLALALIGHSRLALAADNARGSAQPLDTSVSNGAITIDLFQNEAAMGFNITGLTASGATLTIEGSTDAKADKDATKAWFSTYAMPFTCPSPVDFATVAADKSFKLDVTGLTNIRLRVSSTGSGSALVGWNAIPGSTMTTCGGAGAAGSVPTGTAGVPNASVVTVQGITSMTPLAVTGSFSATIGGFTPTPGYASLAAGAASARAVLPTGTSFIVENMGSNPACVLLGNVSVVATSSGALCTGSDFIPANSWVAYTAGAAVDIAAIQTSAGATNLMISGGAGIPTGAGGGGGTSGGGGAVTLASGAVASGAYSSGALAAGSIASGAAVAGAFADGASVTIGAKADAKSTATDTTAITLMQVAKEISAMEQAPASRAVTNVGTFAVQLAATPTLAAGNGVVLATPAGAALDATHGTYANLLQGNAVLSATNGLFSNILQGNAALSATNGLYTNLLQGNTAIGTSNPLFSSIVASGSAITATGTNLNVQCSNCSGSGVSYADKSSWAVSTTLFAPTGGVYQTTATSNPLTNGLQGTWQLTQYRAGMIDWFNTSGVEMGTASTPVQVSLANTAANGTAVSVNLANTAANATPISINVASGNIASGAIASGALASGALAAGSISSGAAVAGAIADGAIVTLGAKADNKSTATDTTAISEISVLKEISAMEQAPASRAVTNAGTFLVQAVESGTWNVGLSTGANTVGKVDILGNAAATMDTTPGGAAATNALQIQGVASMTPVQVSQATAATLNATVVGTGTFATQSAITAASSSISSGAYASGSISDGAMVTLGAKADAKSTATDTTSITAMSVLKEISAMEQAPASRAVTNAGTFLVQAAESGTWNVTNVSGTVSLPTGAATSANQPAVQAVAGTTTSGSTGNLVFGAATTGAPTDATGNNWPLSLTTTGDLRVAAAALPLPSGAATSALQTSGAQETQIIGNSNLAYVTAAHEVQVDCSTGCSGGTFNNNADGVSTSASNGQAAAWLYAFNGGTWDRLEDDANKALKTDLIDLKGNAVDTGSGTGGSGTQRVIIDSSQVNGNGQTTASASAPVVLASDQNAADPCMFHAKVNYALSSNATTATQLIAASGSTKIYVCSISVISAGATAFNLLTGTGTNCGTSQAAVLGSTTAANGMSFAANGGITLGSGSSTVATANLAGAELCILQSNAVYSSGNISYVQQ